MFFLKTIKMDVAGNEEWICDLNIYRSGRNDLWWNCGQCTEPNKLNIGAPRVRGKYYVPDHKMGVIFIGKETHFFAEFPLQNVVPMLYLFLKLPSISLVINHLQQPLK